MKKKKLLINRSNIYPHLVEKMFNIKKKTTQDAILDKKWKEWSISEQEFLDFKKYAVQLIKKVFKCSSRNAQNTFTWFWLSHGLIVK